MKYCRKCKHSFEPRKRHHYLCRECWYNRRVSWPVLDFPAPRPAIPTPWLKRLIQLAHPDRHSGSKLATETTKWLLDQKNQTTA